MPDRQARAAPAHLHQQAGDEGKNDGCTGLRQSCARAQAQRRPGGSSRGREGFRVAPEPRAGDADDVQGESPDLSKGVRPGDVIDFKIVAAKYEILEVTVVARAK